MNFETTTSFCSQYDRRSLEREIYIQQMSDEPGSGREPSFECDAVNKAAACCSIVNELFVSPPWISCPRRRSQTAKQMEPRQTRATRVPSFTVSAAPLQHPTTLGRHSARVRDAPGRVAPAEAGEDYRLIVHTRHAQAGDFTTKPREVEMTKHLIFNLRRRSRSIVLITTSTVSFIYRMTETS